MQSRDDMRSGQVDAVRHETGAHGRLIQQRGKCARIHFACLPATRTAVKTGGERIVLARGAMPDHGEQWREATGEAHCAQDAGGERDAR